MNLEEMNPIVGSVETDSPEDASVTCCTDDLKESGAEEKNEGRGEKDRKKVKRLEAELAELRGQLEKTEARVQEEQDKYLRMLAEYDNFRRRTQKEKESTYADAYADALKTILPVIDNLEKSEQYSEPEAVKKGIAMTLKAAKESFEKLGIAEIETKTFDPNLHNAVMHIEDEEHSEGEIVEVFQKGYQKGERVIRYAMVKVAN